MVKKKEAIKIGLKSAKRQKVTKAPEKVIGVNWDKARNKWYAKYKGKFLGRYTTHEEAVKAREEYINLMTCNSAVKQFNQLFGNKTIERENIIKVALTPKKEASVPEEIELRELQRAAVKTKIAVICCLLMAVIAMLYLFLPKTA